MSSKNAFHSDYIESKRKCACAYFLSSECVLQGGSAVELQSGWGGKGISQRKGGQTKGTQAERTNVLQCRITLVTKRLHISNM